jgi:hypothetical protein
MWNDTSSSPEMARSRSTLSTPPPGGRRRAPGPRRSTARALGDALLVEVVAEDVDAVGAGQVVEDIAVEVGHRHALGGLHEAARLQVLAQEAAELERHAVGAGELQVGDARPRLLRSSQWTLGKRCAKARRQSLQARLPPRSHCPGGALSDRKNASASKS